MQQFILPKIKFGKKFPAVPAVYKMIFDDEYFYIGSSRSVMQRIWRWKFILTKGEKKNFLITEQFKKCKEVKFEILEVLEVGIEPKEREDFYIKENWGNEFFLNRSNDAFKTTAKRTVKQTAERSALVRELGLTQKVAQFDRGGNLIKIHDSVSEASREFGKGHISRCFKKAGLTSHGFIFKRVDKKGNIVEPPVIPRTKPYGKPKGTKLSEESKANFNEKRIARISSPDYTPPSLPYHSKKVNQYDLQGSFVMTHDSIRAAATYMNLKDHRELQKTLNGRAGRTYKKHIWKYA